MLSLSQADEVMAQESVCSWLPLKRTAHSAGEGAAERSQARGGGKAQAAGDPQHPRHQRVSTLPFLQKEENRSRTEAYMT